MEKLEILEENSGVLVAGIVYAYMNQSYHVSRNVRTQWFFRHLHKTVSFQEKTDLQALQDAEIEVLSVYPQDPPPDWGPENSSSYQYLITPSTNVVYLSKNNKAVYCLDLSPSISAVDIQHGQVMLDEIISAMKNSIEGIVRHFVVPGTRLIFEPHLFVTVIVHTPFFTTPAQQVLVQGWRVTETNVEEFLSAIVKQLELLEDTIADVSGLVHDEIENVRLKQAESERLVGGLFEEVPDKQSSLINSISMVGPDSGFINLLRYGMLALRLLPNCNLSNLIVVTDGMITLPDIYVLDSVLTQLRSNAVTVSFLHVGSQFHPHSSYGLVQYTELMEFIALATLGMYIHSPPVTTETDNYNLYHEAFITWCFRRKSSLQSLLSSKSKNNNWKISNQSFYGNREQHLLTKKQSEEHLIASLTSVLCCRLHEGYMIKNVHLQDKELEITMLLPWSNHIYIEYVITSEWPTSSFKNLVHFSLSVKAPYEFLHDITCLMKKPFHSPYRQAVVSRFWGTLKTLSHTDLLLSHLDSFSESTLAYTVPDSIKNGMPLFYLPLNHTPPELSSSGSSCPQFAQFWRPVVLLEPSVWQKWLHTHRLGLILQPDRPFPHSLHMMNFNPRSQFLQCRQAETCLYGCLKKMATFVLIENHSYIKIMSSNESEKGPNWFYIVRVTSKPPCAVIHIAFLGGTPGNLRHQVVEDIKEEISNLRIAQRSDSLRKYDLPMESLRSEVECCFLIQKPLEKILIRYERMPCEFGTVIFPDGTQPVSAAKPLKPASTLITTLSRYLHHKRSIWDTHTPLASHNSLLPTMLTTLTRMRLQEGFRFAHCTAGIINMVMEVQMKCFDEDVGDIHGKYQPCIIQYILFPPHMTSASAKGSNSGDEMADETESEFKTELITECWIEPQHGVVTKSPAHRSYMEKLHYHQIADVIWRVDAECISNLLTFDHLQLMCHNQQISPPISLDPSSLHQNPLENWPHAVAIEDERIHRIPFAYNLMNLLPKCQQAELLSSMFIQELSEDWECKCRNDAPNNLLMENFLTQLQELHHRELNLSDHEATQLLELIMNRPRDSAKHPVPFPSENKKNECRKVSDADSTDTGETIPAASDWARMISWATYSADVSSPSPGSSDDIKNMRKTSKFSPWLKKAKPQIPKWRCFVKSMASTHCVLTFIPASFLDLKLLMLGNEAKVMRQFDVNDVEDSKTTKLVLESNLNPEAEPFHPRLPLGSETPCRGSSKSSSRNLIDSNCSEEDLVFDAVSGMKETARNTFDNPFRDRSSSWDPMKRQSEHSKFDLRRTRTSSVGAKIKPQQWSLLRKASEDEEVIKHHKTFVAALTLPIYIYDCPLSNLVDALIFKASLERRPDIFQDKTNKGEKGTQSDNSYLGKTDNDTTPDELDLHYHCKVVLQAFNKCFVVALFKSLHLNHKVNHADIQTAVDECEETLLEIDITKYIQTICGHYKQLLKDNLETKNMSSVMPLSCQTAEVMPLHKLIKQRFMEILTVCFKVVPSTPEYYFCCPTQLSRIPVDNIDFDNITLQSDLIEFSSNQNSLAGIWDRIGIDSTFDDARTSLLSNMDSDSISDSLYDIGDDLFPLFLHLVCSIRSQNKDFMQSNAVKVLPTCIGELFCDSKINETSLDLSKATVTLDMYCLTLPVPYPADMPVSEMNQHSESSGTANALCESQIMAHTEQHFSLENLKTIDRLQHLPFQQHKAISICITEIEWFLNDEIAVFLLDSQQVTETTLSFVATHVTNSKGRYSCLLNMVNLNFVFGVKHSLEKFIKEVSHMKVPGYKLKKEGDFYYIVKDTTAPAPAKFYSFPSIPDANSTLLSGDDTKSIDGCNSITSTSDIRCESEWDFIRKGYCSSMSNKWITDLHEYRKDVPNFWLILKVDEEKVTSYFHCRFLEIHSEEVQHYREVHSQVLNNIEAVCKAVNQTLLLQSLHETRMCDPLLEPETSEDIWKPNQLLVRSNEESADVEVRGNDVDVIQKFQPGWFSCPVVWQTHFLLHPRLKTGPGKPGLSRAIQALRTVLNRFSVNNRTNMFVYQDNHQNSVFYLRLHENMRFSSRPPAIEEDSSPGSVSRSSSINSLNNRKPAEELSTRDILPKLRSFDDSNDSLSQRNEDFLTLKVHGISEAGIEVKNELVQVLQNRLDDAVLEVVSVMLARNPMCKLSSDDVHFIQKPNRHPDEIIQLTLPQYSYPYLDALSYYMRQNLLQFLFLPKYIDTRTQFQDYSQPEGSPRRMGESCMYLYNQSPVSGNKGIACLAISLVDNVGNVILPSDSNDLPSMNLKVSLDNQEAFDIMTDTNIVPNSNSTDCPEVMLETRIWKQGRINMEALIKKLKCTVKYALWDLITEFCLLRAPLFEDDPESSSKQTVLNHYYYKLVPQWLKFGFDLNVPAVRTHSIKLVSRHAINITVKEINQLIISQEPSTFVFYEDSYKNIPLLVDWKNDIPCSSCCLLISGNMPQLKSIADLVTISPLDIETKSQKCNQKLSSYSFSPFDNSHKFIPRQTFVLAIINNCEIDLFMYNWSKDRVENMTKLLSQLGHWLSSRSNFLTGVISQKLGLFHNQPFVRKSSSQLGYPDLNDLESLLTFSQSSSKKISYNSLSHYTQILRDSEPSFYRKITNDPVCSNINQILSIKSCEKREQQKKLRIMWQSRSATPYIPMSENTLDLFMRFSRIIHYCLTPLLFLPHWRLQSAATRDQTLLVAPLQQVFEFSKRDCSWHEKMCSFFMVDYKKYLLSLGFVSVQITPSTPQKLNPNEEKPAGNLRCYLQKSLLGGILMFEISLSEPFFQVQLHALECSRLQGKSSPSLLSQIIFNFLEECDKMKVSMHLHSFTYDYHLRSLHSYISDQQSLLETDYHITSFLDDFLKYYPKAPNFARNLAYSGSLSVSDLVTPALQLFNYLLSHAKDYDLDVKRLTVNEKSNENEIPLQECEYVLIKFGPAPSVTFRESHDIKNVDDLDMTLIITYDKSSRNMTIKLHYYIILSTSRDLYPKLEMEWKLGKFCNVSTVNCQNTPQKADDDMIIHNPDCEIRENVTDPENSHGTEHLGIRQEAVNYLGYYSSHEQLMHQIIVEEASAACKSIENMVKKGSVDCRVHFLWNKLLSNNLTNPLSYTELFEMKELAYIQSFLDLDGRLGPLLSQPVTWYQGLMKILMAKYSEKHKIFTSSDNNNQHLLILHPRFLDGFVMMSMDITNNQGELNIIYRQPPSSKNDDAMLDDIYSLVEGVVNACCFHLWSSMIS